MSVVVTRTIQIICLLVAALSIFAILGSHGEVPLIASWAAVLGFAVLIFLAAAILRVLSDVSEKVLAAMGYRKDRAQ